MKTKEYLFLLFAFILVTACKNGKRDILTSTPWQAVSLQNPQIDIILAQGQHFIDTVGQSTDTQSNIETYGTDDMDAYRKSAQEKLDSIKALQMDAVTNTWFKFRKDGMAVLSFSGYIDSTKWHFDDDGNLILDKLEQTVTGRKIKMQVQELSDTALKLEFIENGNNCSVTFHPGEK